MWERGDKIVQDTDWECDRLQTGGRFHARQSGRFGRPPRREVAYPNASLHPNLTLSTAGDHFPGMNLRESSSLGSLENGVEPVPSQPWDLCAKAAPHDQPRELGTVRGVWERVTGSLAS